MASVKLMPLVALPKHTLHMAYRFSSWDLLWVGIFPMKMIRRNRFCHNIAEHKRTKMAAAFKAAV